MDIILKSDFRAMHTLPLYYEHFDIRMIPCEVKNKNLRRPLEQSPEDLEKKQKKRKLILETSPKSVSMAWLRISFKTPFSKSN